ncbi:hypothetical protein HMI48_11725 [Acidithiobacillus ferrooxidans]|uniref:hypothetical protein n=1 Tax=Acidithiobacillus ferrooxidans TaxID=920 RepID=UPI001C072E3E|nr:hypothetical protein [Acidithiobacillus ferrooxidans]MBU2774509.1 hypothetical protein [Acidithiobacillus ferrooxidans]
MGHGSLKVFGMKTSVFVLSAFLIPSLAMATTGQFQAYLNKEAKLGITYNPLVVAQMVADGKPGFAKCAPPEGTKVLVVGEHGFEGISDFFSQVKVLDGRCRGERGWVKTSKLSATQQ